ncbi:MAG: L,D-transpeptidase family protein [Deltaproteobacteria bacterium]|nr:L,D-transpeptidase family protein [Deltaproteobacteria bacterium]
MKSWKTLRFTAGRMKPRFFSSILCTIVLMSWQASVQTALAKQDKDAMDRVPSAFLRWPEKGSPYAILVDKSAQKVHVYKKSDPSVPARSYPCSTGENDGKKSRQNDRRTPEGIYFFINAYEQKDLAPIYGVRAFPLDYPNPLDKREGRDGYGIWFHGTNKPLKPKDTNGCIVLENRNIEDLSSFVELYDTPVIISPMMEMIDAEKLRKEREELERIVEGWRNAWETKQIDRYMSYYSQRFTSGGKDWKEWKEYKARLARQYKRIRVELENLALYRNDGTVMATFRQRYNTAGFDSRGYKRIFLQQNSKQWKIVGEFFEAEQDRPKFALRRPVSAPTAPQPPLQEEKPRVAAVEKKSPPPVSVGIKDFIEQWRRAWERQDLKTYMSCYDPGFSSRGMGFKAWKEHRDGLNRKHRSVHVQVRDLKIRASDDQTATVTFVQDYRADDYRDKGMKTILLQKRGPHWKIKKEEWRPLRKGDRP